MVQNLKGSISVTLHGPIPEVSGVQEIMYDFWVHSVTYFLGQFSQTL